MVEQPVHSADVESVPCPVCGPAPYKIWMEDGKPTRYLRCRSCRTIYASPRSTWSARYAWLDEKFGLCEPATENARRRIPALRTEAQFILKHKRCGKLLDVGCDLGDFFEMFPPPDWERHGVELSPSAAAFAAQKHGAQVKAGTLIQAEYPGESFDVITLIDLFYYMDDPHLELKEIHRVLKPDGLVAIEFPGQAYQMMRSRGLISRLLDGRWTRLRTDSAYINWYSPKALQRLLVKNGFEILEWRLVASPVQNSVARSLMTRAYVDLVSLMARISMNCMSFVPKYFVIAKRLQ